MAVLPPRLRLGLKWIAPPRRQHLARKKAESCRNSQRVEAPSDGWGTVQMHAIAWGAPEATNDDRSLPHPGPYECPLLHFGFHAQPPRSGGERTEYWWCDTNGDVGRGHEFLPTIRVEELDVCARASGVVESLDCFKRSAPRRWSDVAPTRS